MAYNSFLYLGAFLGLAYVLWALLPAQKRPFGLLFASVVFYWIGSGKYIVWIVAAAVITWLTGLMLGRLDELYAQAGPHMEGAEKKAYRGNVKKLKGLVAGIGCTVMLAAFLAVKYGTFTVQSINGVLARLPGHAALALPAWGQPLGLSFFTLMAVSYLVDVLRGVCKPARQFWQVALYLGFWPHVVEGPFDRYGALAPALLSAQQKPDYRNLTFGAQRIVWGMFKKVVIADRANMYVNAVFNDYTQYSGAAVAIGTLLYTLQLYAEFSGCMDIALGSAEIFGIPMAENFRQPFFSKSVGEFWRRWHLTLGAWLKEYLFQPLIVSRPFIKLGKKCREKFGAAAGRNLPVWLGLFVTWVAIGAWHDPGWKYIAYGLYYCALQLLGEMLEPLLRRLMPKLPEWRKMRWYRAWQIVRTFVLVNLGMLLFRSNGGAAAFMMLKNLTKPYEGSLLIKLDARDIGVLVIGAIMIFVVDLLHERGVHIREKIAGWHLPVRWAVYLVAVIAVIVFGAYGDSYDPAAFIYAQF
jgi:D-alanyl-lipoteichoic acid acyltransferase DltB (MBOAT superfamily)